MSIVIIVIIIIVVISSIIIIISFISIISSSSSNYHYYHVCVSIIIISVIIIISSSSIIIIVIISISIIVIIIIIMFGFVCLGVGGGIPGVSTQLVHGSYSQELSPSEARVGDGDAAGPHDERHKDCPEEDVEDGDEDGVVVRRPDASIAPVGVQHQLEEDRVQGDDRRRHEEEWHDRRPLRFGRHRQGGGDAGVPAASARARLASPPRDAATGNMLMSLGVILSYLGDSRNTVGGCCLDTPRFEESLNN